MDLITHIWLLLHFFFRECVYSVRYVTTEQRIKSTEHLTDMTWRVQHNQNVHYECIRCRNEWPIVWRADCIAMAAVDGLHFDSIKLLMVIAGNTSHGPHQNVAFISACFTQLNFNKLHQNRLVLPSSRTSRSRACHCQSAQNEFDVCFVEFGWLWFGFGWHQRSYFGIILHHLINHFYKKRNAKHVIRVILCYTRHLKH